MDGNRILGSTQPHMWKHPKNTDLRSRFEDDMMFDLSYTLLFGFTSKPRKRGGWIKELLSETVLLSLQTVCDHKLLKTEGSSLDRSSCGTAEIPHVTRAE